jgi:phospholipid/cholesterol/gamma-HCH transport system substrate-binding protein
MVTKIWKRIDRRVVALVALLVVVGVGVNAFSSPAEMKTVTAHFDRAVSVYENTEVRILGVKVGRVTSVTPAGNSVRSSSLRRSSPTGSCSSPRSTPAVT